MATLILARLTFLEAIRRRILLAAFLLGLAFLVLYGVGFCFMAHEISDFRSGTSSEILRNGMYNFLVTAGLYAVNFLAIAMGALVSADTLAGEIGSGTIQAIVTKPVSRAQVVLGKWLGLAVLLALYLVLMAGGVMGIGYVEVGYFVPNVLAGVSLIYLGALLIMTVTLACSSALSTLATGGVIFGLYGIAFIGGWVEQIGALLENNTAVDIGILSSLFIPSDALWRRAAYEMTPPVAQVLGISGSPLITFSVPSAAMILYAGVYLLIALALAVRQFQHRDL
jgi:Cu-processing system permease protein